MQGFALFQGEITGGGSTMRRWTNNLLVTGALLAGLPLAHAEAKQDGAAVAPSVAPAVDSAQRRAILDALRPEIADATHGPVEFVVQHLEVQDGWALVWAHPQRPGGAQIDPEAVLPAAQLEFTSSIRVDALLQMRDGDWNLEGYRIGATDVWYACYPGAPATLTGCEHGGAESPAGSFGSFPADFPSSDWMSNSAACYLYLMIGADAAGGRNGNDPTAMQQAAGQWRAQLRQALSEQEVLQFTASETNFRLQTPAAERDNASQWCVENAP